MKLFIDPNQVRLVRDKGEVVTIPAAAVTEISYGQDVHRRVGAAIGLAVVSLGIGALMALTKSKKHYVGLTWTDGDKKGGFAMQCDKNEYRRKLRCHDGEELELDRSNFDHEAVRRRLPVFIPTQPAAFAWAENARSLDFARDDKGRGIWSRLALPSFARLGRGGHLPLRGLWWCLHERGVRAGHFPFHLFGRPRTWCWSWPTSPGWVGEHPSALRFSHLRRDEKYPFLPSLSRGATADSSAAPRSCPLRLSV